MNKIRIIFEYIQEGMNSLNTITVLDSEQVGRLLTLPMAVRAVERAYVFKNSGRASLFPVVTHVFREGEADLDIKSGELRGCGIFGLKLVSWFGENPQRGLPALMGTLLVFDSETGAPIGLMNAGQITGMRTGAAAAVGSKYLARRDSRTLLMVGSGTQAPYQIMAHLECLDGIEQVLVYDPLALENARIFCEGLRPLLQERFVARESGEEQAHAQRRIAVPFRPVDSLPAALAEADIVVTATPSRRPLIDSADVRPGTHLSCMGADMSGKQETDVNLPARCRLFADDIAQSMEIGECEAAAKAGLISADRYCAEIGEVISGQKPGRLCDRDITLFDSSGIALQDLSTAAAILSEAERLGVGSRIAL